MVIDSPTTAHEVRQRARCNNCGVTGNNTYQIVYPGNSDVAMDGATMHALLSDRAVVLGSRSTGLGKMVKEPQARFKVAKLGVYCHTARI